MYPNVQPPVPVGEAADAYLKQNLKKTARQPQINQLLMLVDLLRRSPSVPPPE